MTKHRPQLLAVVAAAALLAGCVSGTATSSESAATSRSDRGMVDFARCMRAHGVNMSDPFHRPGHEGLTVDLPEQGPATSNGYNACGHYLEATLLLKEQTAARRITPTVRLGLIHYAECMRSHAIGMLDPDPTGQLALGNVPGIDNSLGRYTPQFAAADRACRHVLPASVPDDGTGP
jgi:hypothetical protein